MSALTRSTGNAFASLLGTVGSTADMISRTVNSTASAVDMFDAYVQRAKRNQRIQHRLEDKFWQHNLIIDMAREQERKETEIKREYATDDERRATFLRLTAELEALLNDDESE